MKFNISDQVRALSYLNNVDSMIVQLEARYSAELIDYFSYQRELNSLLHIKCNLLKVVESVAYYHDAGSDPTQKHA